MKLMAIILVFSLGAVGKTLNGFTLKDPLIPVEKIMSGGPPKDGIPSIDNPKFVKAGKALEGIVEDDRALVVETDSVKKVYPISILNWHEVVNDEISGAPIVVTFCPLCGTGIVFSRTVKGKTLEYGVSGLLYQSDVLLYDRQTESLWSQLELKAISGKYKGTPMQVIASSHVNLEEYLKENSDALVLSTETGHKRNYALTPYAGYEKSENMFFPVEGASDKYPKKTWSILLDKKLLIPISSLKEDKGQKDFKVGNEVFTVSWDKADRELVCENNKSRCLTGFFFALSAFYPEADIN